jgi:phosphatidylglycerophosphate synthase
MSDKLFYGTVLAMFVAMTGHPWIALIIFIITL